LVALNLFDWGLEIAGRFFLKIIDDNREMDKEIVTFFLFATIYLYFCRKICDDTE